MYRRLLLSFMSLWAYVLPLLSQYNNIDFENGDLSGWEAYIGDVTTMIVGNETINVIQANTKATFNENPLRHEVLSGDIVDSIAFNGQIMNEDGTLTDKNVIIPVVHPSGKYSLKLGNISAGAQAERIVRSFKVVKDKPYILYRYAVILEEPEPSGNSSVTEHDSFERPRFEIKVYDTNGDPLTCGEYSVTAGDSAKENGFVRMKSTFYRPIFNPFIPNFRIREEGEFWVKNWSTEVIDLTSYIGETITLEFATADCTHKGHAGYAYVDASVEMVDINFKDFCPGATELTTSVESGFLYYEWSNGDKGLETTYQNPKDGDVIKVTVSSSAEALKKGCATTLSRTIDLNVPQPTLNDIPDCKVCIGQEITLEASGNNIGSYKWLDGSGGESEGASYKVQADRSLDLKVVASDLLGCQKVSKEVSIGVKELNANGTSVDNTCPSNTNGSITLNPSGGDGNYKYEWKDGSGVTTATRDELAKGDYDVTITDENGAGCSLDTTINVGEAITMTLNGESTSAKCTSATGTAKILASGNPGTNYLYKWSTGAETQEASNLAPGTYDVTVTEDKTNGCIAEASVEVKSITENVGVNLVVDELPDCNASNGVVTVKASGGSGDYTYRLNDSFEQTAEKFTNIAEGEVNIKVTDNNTGCTGNALTKIASPNSIVLNLEKDDPLCNSPNGQIRAIATGGNGNKTYGIDGGAESDESEFMNLGAGTYKVLVRDQKNCTRESQITLVNQPSDIVLMLAKEDPLCNQPNGIIIASATGGNGNFLYSIDGGIERLENKFESLATGTHKVFVKDRNNCTAESQIDLVNQPSNIVLTLNKEDPLCNQTNGIITASVTGGNGNFLYRIDGGIEQSENKFEGLATGTHKVFVKDQNNCTAESQIGLVNIPSDITLNLSKKDPICDQPNGIISAVTSGGNGDFKYTINGGAEQTGSNFQKLAAGVYKVLVRDKKNCKAEAEIALNQYPPLAIQLDKNDPFCSLDDGSIRAIVTGGIPNYSFVWSNGENTTELKNIGAGIYELIVIDSNNCIQKESVELIPPNNILNVKVESENPTCEDEENGWIKALVSGGTPPYTFDWGGFLNEEDETLEQIGVGNYQVNIIDANGCEKDEVAVLDAPQNTIGINYYTTKALEGMNNGSIQLSVVGGLPPYDITWPLLNKKGLMLSNISSGEYNVLVEDANGCLKEQLIDVYEIELIKPTNAFTPNGDGKNDFWVIKEIENFTNASVIIYTRWGNKVYETLNYEIEPWDGMMNGQRLPVDTYYYVIDLKVEGVNSITGYVDLVN